MTRSLASKSQEEASASGVIGPRRRPSRILFASCNSQHYEPVLWPAMTSRNASAFVWVGDAVYGDDFYEKESVWTNAKVREATPTMLQDLYQQLLNQPGYQRFTRRDGADSSSSSIATKNRMVVMGTFDDHDYGINNGDKFYRYKNESALLYMQFLKDSTASPPSVNWTVMEQRAAAGKGIYGVKVFDFRRPFGEELLSDDEAALEPLVLLPNHSDVPPLLLSDRSVAIFVIDCRSNKDPWKTGIPQKYWVDYEADFLGAEQWEWLQTSLSRSTATVNVVVQGLQVHADRYFDGNMVEDWSRFPLAQHKLYQTILQSNVSAPVLVSGDVHMAELLRKDCRRRISTRNFSAAQMLLEVTVSGMTHSWCTNICARPQRSLMCRTMWFQKALCAGMHLAHNNYAWTDLIDEKSPEDKGAKQGIQYVLERNFGEFEFDWDRRKLIVRILGEGGTPLLSTAWNFDLLTGKTPAPETGKVDLLDYELIHESLSAHGAQPNDWICVNHRGNPSLARKLFGFVSPVVLATFITLLPLILPTLLGCIILRRRWSIPRKAKQS